MSIWSFFTSLETAIKNEVAKVLPSVKQVWGVVKPYVEITAEELAPIAVQAVASAATLAISGDAKFALAVSNVISAAATQGKSVILSNASSAVQAAYNETMRQLGATAAPLPTAAAAKS